MRSGPFTAHGWRLGEALPEVGRARRHACARTDEADGAGAVSDGGEIWLMDADAAAVARRLLALGERGVGLFLDGGVDERGVWLWRAPSQPTLASLLAERGRRPLPHPAATDMVIAIARAQAACEAESLFSGPIEPARIVLAQPLDPAAAEPDGVVSEMRAHLVAEPLVYALVGASEDAGGATRPSAESRWLAPEQAAGAPFDNAGNRYVIALIWYRLLAGAHPFSGTGLRRALAYGAERGVPPLPDPIARELPPGMHSAVCRALDKDPAKRPSSAEELATLARSFLSLTPAPSRPVERISAGGAGAASTAAEGRAPLREDPLRALREHRAARGRRGPETVKRDDVPDKRARSGRSEQPARSTRSKQAGAARAGLAGDAWVKYFWLSLPLAGAGLALLWLLLSSNPARDGSRPSTTDRATQHGREHAPLTQAETRARDCAGCHPRQVAEWRRSIMAHSAKSPLFQALEMLIQEQAGKSFACPGGAGVLRAADPATACRAPATGLELTGSGGPLWCVNCHAPAENLSPAMPRWNGLAQNSASRRPLRELLPESAMEGISCAFCHQVHGPVQPGLPGYSGNPFWTSTDTGRRLAMRPEDTRGLFGIGNSGYRLDPGEFLAQANQATDASALVRGGAHRRPSADARRYLRSSEFCGACHDVRLFGSDVLGARVGEHFKRLRNAYSEWSAWRDQRARAGRETFTCQDCHMSEFPGVCQPDDRAPEVGPEASPDAGPELNRTARRSSALSACPPGTHFVQRAPGRYPLSRTSAGSERAPVTSHYFSGVDLPLAPDFDMRSELAGASTLDATGIPLGARQRRDILLGRTFRFEVGAIRATGPGSLEVPIELENIGAGHRVPAGFSQEREFWVHLRVLDASGALLYEVGRVDRGDQDLGDKIFQRVTVDDSRTDRQGRPLGLFGADVIDGPDRPEWSPPPGLGGQEFRGKGLINLQNGFLRCVRCIGRIDADGRCQPGPGQGFTRADRYQDGAYDPDTGACVSNLAGREALFEVYFPVGALDATRGLTKGPDAIVDTRSLAPETPVRYLYELTLPVGARGPFTVEARLLFRAFPPFLLRAFADYEVRMARAGARPSGPLIDHAALERLEVVEVAAVREVGP